MNHKRIYRVYAAAKLQVRKRVKRRVALGRGEAITPASQPNVRWSLDFVHDTLQNGRRIRTLNVVDDFTRESIAIEVDTSIAGARVARVLDRIANERGAYPQTLVMDNGPELTSLAGACVVVTDSRTIALHRAGAKPTQNAFIESFNGKFRDECLNDNIFSSLAEARKIIESWRFDYNHFRPHQSLGHRTPNEFAAAHSPSPLSLRS